MEKKEVQLPIVEHTISAGEVITVDRINALVQDVAQSVMDVVFIEGEEVEVPADHPSNPTGKPMRMPRAPWSPVFGRLEARAKQDEDGTITFVVLPQLAWNSLGIGRQETIGRPTAQEDKNDDSEE